MYGRRRKRRKRRGYVRPSRARAKAGWTLRELAALAGTTPRLIRGYIEQGVVPSPPFASSATRYGRPQLLRLVAARRLRVGEKLELAKIKTRLNEMTAGEIEAFVVSGLGAGPLAAALGVAVATAATPAAADPSFGTQPPLGGLQVSPDRRWTRLELAVGLELHIRDDVAAPALELARQIWRLCVQGVPPTPPAKT